MEKFLNLKEEAKIKKNINELEDFIHSPKHGNSLTKFMSANQKYINGVPDSIIKKILMLTDEELKNIQQNIINSNRQNFKIDV